MKAIDIINFINEDKFSKYTLDQVYDELGEEDFIEYLTSLSSKVIKNIDPKRDMSQFKAEIGDTYGNFYIEFINLQVQYVKEFFIVEWFPEEEENKEGLGIAYGVGSGKFATTFIELEDKNTDKLLKEKLTKVYNKTLSKHYRRQYIESK